MGVKDIITVLISASALLLTVILNVKATAKQDTSQITTVIVKLENIQNIVTETKNDIKAMKEDIRALDKRITKVELRTEAAHQRIDRMKQNWKLERMPDET